MIQKEDLFFENLFYQYLDELKFLFFPDKWGNNLLDYSKNELLAITFIYRKENVNMSEIAEYINAPLNTVTGVINRLEKKRIVERKRDANDKRVVNICLSDEGKDIYETEKKEIVDFVKKVYNALTDEEKSTVMGVTMKVISILKHGNDSSKKQVKEVKRVKKIVIE